MRLCNVAKFVGQIALVPAVILFMTAGAQATDRYGNPGVSALEDCLRFNPDRVEAKRISGRWKVVEGSHWMFDFGSGGGARREARTAVRVIKHYKMNESCFVGRPHASFSYLLSRRAAPRGAMSHEDCIAFDRRGLRVRPDGSRWLLTDGHSRMVVFDKADEAFLSLFLIRYYGFSRQCFVGRPQPDFVYWRR